MTHRTDPSRCSVAADAAPALFAPALFAPTRFNGVDR